MLVAAEAVGIGRSAIDLAVRYANERVVFDRPIGKNQAVQFPLADAHSKLEVARLMVERGALLYDRGEPCGAEANIAKLRAADAAFEACDAALQVHGGMGYAAEYHIERLVARGAALSRSRRSRKRWRSTTSASTCWACRSRTRRESCRMDSPGAPTMRSQREFKNLIRKRRVFGWISILLTPIFLLLFVGTGVDEFGALWGTAIGFGAAILWFLAGVYAIHWSKTAKPPRWLRLKQFAESEGKGEV